MEYTVVQQDEDEGDGGREVSSPQQTEAASQRLPPLKSPTIRLFLDTIRNGANDEVELYSPLHGLNYMSPSRTSRSTRSTHSTNCDMIDEDDFSDDGVREGGAPSPTTMRIGKGSPRTPATAQTATTTARPIVRTTSGAARNFALQHPTPDLQVLQGAYTGNIEQLERTAERLSMTSSIDDAIKELHDEQKRTDSRRSSLLSSQGMQKISRQFSNTSSIVEVNSVARSGGYSPAGFMMSPKGSLTGGRGRSTSKSTQMSRPEPEMEGRPLDSFTNLDFSNFSLPPPSPDLNRAIPGQHDEDTTTLTRPVVDHLESPNKDTPMPIKPYEDDRASINTFDQAKMFEGFDGTHVEPLDPEQRTISGDFSGSRPVPQRTISGSVNGSIQSDENAQKRVSSRLSMMSMPRPQSYADPTTGQQMVYYPAPVPMMLNLPQKLSKAPSSMARNKRRSQVFSTIPAAARQSAIWLPDVLENAEDGDKPEDDDAPQEYMAQHQRASMGGRRLTQDMSHMPAQLRASTFFDLPGPNQIVELKDQSAVATLDSILDASAHAPVSAFTDHAFAGALGNEVYGRTHNRVRSSANLLETQKKRTSSFNMLLRGKRASTSDLLADKRASTMNGLVEGTRRMPLEDGDSDDGNVVDTTPLQQSDAGDRSHGDYGKGAEDDESDDGQRDDEMYYGAPTTLLAELQLRKQQQKHRTRPLASAYPNGMHSTLLEMDAVAQVEQKSRKQKRVNLAWEDPAMQEAEDVTNDDEDVPLAMLYAKKAQSRDMSRPMGLMERREMEDNEPLSSRRNRLQGRPPPPRASTMMNMSTPLPPATVADSLADESAPLPKTRPVSGDFASEMMSQFGGDLLDKGKGKEIPQAEEEEETLGQRRKRLQAEREARALEVGNAGEAPLPHPELKTRRSMADILSAHPSAGAEKMANYQKPVGGLLGLHEKNSARRASSMLNLEAAGITSRAPAGGFKKGTFNDGQGGIIPPQSQRHNPYNMYAASPAFPQPSIGNFNGFNPALGGGQQMMMPPFANPYAAMSMGMGMGGMGMQMPYNPNLPMEPLNQGQLDMVERWRQSVMQ